MRAMRFRAFLLLLVSAHVAAADRAPPTEADFRRALGVADKVKLFYRNLDCNTVTFEKFSKAMDADGVKSEVERAMDGSSVTVTVRRNAGESCPSPYAPVTGMPEFEMSDLAGKRVNAAALKGKPTLINFYFAQCVPCILEVGPINRYAAEHPEMNFLAVTFDDPRTAHAFVERYKFHWRVVPDAREFIDRMKVKQYPMMALFDSGGRLLGMRVGGVHDELEAANVVPQLSRWVDGLLRVNQKEPGALSGR
jgi:thiol-disulfide isomerase/thioredoxin